jgi:hypothetical protein
VITLADLRLSPRLRGTLATLARVVVTDDVLELGIVDEVVDEVELLLRAVPTPVRLGFLAGLRAFDASARAAPSSRGRRFADLPPDLADAHFDRWWSSSLAPMHQMAKGARMFVAMAYYEHPKVRERLGYDPEAWIEKVKRERTEQHGEEIRAHEAMILEPRPLLVSTRRGSRKLPTAEAQNASA